MAGQLYDPLDGEKVLTSGFGPRRKPLPGASSYHQAADYGGEVNGKPVRSAGDGEVIFAAQKGGYGNFVQIRHTDGRVSSYGHLGQIKVKPGQSILAGEELGAVGQTGTATAPHLHFEVEEGGRKVDPTKVIKPVQIRDDLPAEQLVQYLQTLDEGQQVEYLEQLYARNPNKFKEYEAFSESFASQPGTLEDTGQKIDGRPVMRMRPEAPNNPNYVSFDQMDKMSDEEIAQMPEELVEQYLQHKEKIERDNDPAADDRSFLDWWKDDTKQDFNNAKRAVVNFGTGLASVPGLAIDAMLTEEEKAAGQGWGGITSSFQQKLGVEPPRTEEERQIERVASSLGSLATLRGVGAGMTAAPGKIGKIGEILAAGSAPMMYGSAGVGSYAGGKAAEAGWSEPAQLGVELAASLTPEVTARMGSAALRKFFGKADPKVISDFQRLGTTPSVAEATGTPRSRKTYSFLSRLFGTDDIIQPFARGQEAKIGQKVFGDAEALAPSYTKTDTGMVVKEGMEGYKDPAMAASMGKPADYEFGWMPRQKRINNDAWNQFGREVNKDWMVDTSDLENFLQNRLRTNPKDVGKLGAAADTERGFYGEMLARLEANIQGNATYRNKPLWNKDGTPVVDGQGVQKVERVVSRKGGTPFEALQTFRTDISSDLEKALLNGSQDAGRLRAIYGLTSEMMKKGLKAQDAATASKSMAAFDKASKLTTEYHKTLETIGRALERSGGYEKVYQAVTAGSKDGATVLNTVMQNLDKPRRKILAGEFLKDMAKSTKKEASADDFSLQDFLGKYNTMSDEAKDAIMGQLSPTMRKDFDTIFSVGRNIARGKTEYGVATSPREAGAGRNFFLYPLFMASSALASGALGQEAAGMLGTAAGTIGGATIAYVAGRSIARRMIDPKFVNFLARGAEAPVEMIPTIINQMTEHARAQNDPELMRIAEFYRNEYNAKEQK